MLDKIIDWQWPFVANLLCRCCMFCNLVMILDISNCRTQYHHIWYCTLRRLISFCDGLSNLISCTHIDLHFWKHSACPGSLGFEDLQQINDKPHPGSLNIQKLGHIPYILAFEKRKRISTLWEYIEGFFLFQQLLDIPSGSHSRDSFSSKTRMLLLAYLLKLEATVCPLSFPSLASSVSGERSAIASSLFTSFSRFLANIPASEALLFDPGRIMSIPTNGREAYGWEKTNRNTE